MNKPTKQSHHNCKPASEDPNRSHPTHSARDPKSKLLNPGQRESIAARCLVFGASRWTVMREYGVHISDIDDICDQAMYQRGFVAGQNAERFTPNDSPRTARRRAV